MGRHPEVCGARWRQVVRTGVTAGLGAALASVALALSAAPAMAVECGNEAIRTEQQSTFLPECRAYELASPASNPAVSAYGSVDEVRAAVDGNALAYGSNYSIAGGGDSRQFLARRGTEGWTVEATTPMVTAGGAGTTLCEPKVGYSPNLNRRVLGAGWDIQFEEPGEKECQEPEVELVAGEPRGFGNLYLDEEGRYTLINPPGAAAPGNGVFLGGSQDLSRIVFSENATLTPEAPAGATNLYVWRGGGIHLMTVLPNGKATAGRLAGDDGGATNRSAYVNAVSEDGERVLFEAEANLYLRVNASMEPAPSGAACEPGVTTGACTIQIDLSHGLGASGGGKLLYANTAGTRIFFTDESRLTADSTAASEEPDLYEYDVEDRQLRDLTVDPGGHADVRGFSGAGEDGAYLYFVARGVLSGSQQNSMGAVAQANEPNLYEEHEGALTFIATLQASTDYGDWEAYWGGRTSEQPYQASLRARSSPSGVYLAFNSKRELTGVTNTPAASEDCELVIAGTHPCSNIFLYDAEDGKISCASCSPVEASPTAEATIPGPTAATASLVGQRYLSRNVTDGGQVFFTTANALLPEDVNGVADVYEYRQGTLSLLSPGAANAPATFQEASVGGEDVFFGSSQALVGSAPAGQERLYDARVGGGYTGSGIDVSAPPACESIEGCRPPLGEPPAEAFGASGAFTGPADLTTVEAPLKKPSGTGKSKQQGHKTLTLKQLLKRALKRCRQRPKRRRRQCRHRARERFAAGHNERRHGHKNAHGHGRRDRRRTSLYGGKETHR